MATPPVEPLFCLTFNMTPARYPVSKRGVWDPVIGSGPFILDRIPDNIKLSHGVMTMLVLCAEKILYGMTTKDLGRYRGFYSNSNFDFGDNGTSAAILDVAGKVITIRGTVMSGDNTTSCPIRTTTESNFRSQRGRDL